MKRGKFLDIVICGPDFSGTSTQIEGCISFFQNKKLKVRDMRGPESHALFHAEKFKLLNKDSQGLNQFLDNPNIDKKDKTNFIMKSYELLSGISRSKKILVASMVKNDVSLFVDPHSADVWVFEEPTRRSAGQVNRTVEQYRSKFGSEIDPKSAAITHSVYRVDEWFRFRKNVRDSKKICLRSRCEESGVYQIYDKDFFPKGVSFDFYFSLSGHKIAFQNPPTHIFIVCGPENWDRKDYINLRNERNNGRNLDDYEKSIDYQLLVNQRYSTNWMENFYEKGTSTYRGKMPDITRFNIYNSKKEIMKNMERRLNQIIINN